MKKFGDFRTTFILWNDIQPGMSFIRPFEGVVHFVEIVNLPFIRVRQSITGADYVISGWRGIQALDYSVQTEHEIIVEAFEEKVALSCGQEDRTIRFANIEMRNIFTEIEHGKTETRKTPLEDILFDATLREVQREKYSGRNKKRFIDFPLGDIDFQPKRREKED